MADEKLRAILSEAKGKGASEEQLIKLIQAYQSRKKKDSTESSSSGETENTGAASSAEYDKNFEDNNAAQERPAAPGWMENIKDGSPLKKRGVDVADSGEPGDFKGEEDALARREELESATVQQLSESEKSASDYTDFQDVYDEAGVPEELRPKRRFVDSQGVVLGDMAMDTAGKGREAAAVSREYEELFESKQVSRSFTSGLGDFNTPQTIPAEADGMSPEELALRESEAAKKINKIMGYDENTPYQEAKKRALEAHAFSKSILSDIALERATQEVLEDKAVTTKGEILTGQQFFGEFMEGLGAATVDPVVKSIGANAAIAYFDATGQSEKAEMVAMEMQQSSTENMLRVGLDPNDSRGITETFRDGETSNAALKFVYYGSQSMGLMAVTVANPAVGITLMGTSTGLDTYSGYRDRLDMSSEDKIALAVGAGLTEVLMGQVLGGLGNLRRFRSAIGVSDDIGSAALSARRTAYNKALKYIEPYSSKVKSVLSNPKARATGRFIYDTSAEAIEELGVELTNQIFAHAIAGEDFDPLALADAALLGGGMGAGFASVTSGKVYGIESSFFNKPLKEDMSEFEDLQAMYSDLKQAAREEKDPAKRKIILKEAASVRAEGQVLVQKANSAYDKLSFEERAELTTLNKGVTNLIKDIKESTSKTTKNRLKNNLVAQLLRKSEIESKAGVSLQVETNEKQELEDLSARETTSVNISKKEGVPLQTALDLTNEIQAKRKAARESLAKSTPSELIDKRVRFLNPVTNETEEGFLIKDGQRLAVETDSGNIIDIDSYEKSSKKPLEELGIYPAEGIIEPNEDGSFTYKPRGGAAPQGATMVNNNGVQAIKRNPDGSVKNVILTSPDGSATYNLKGEDAEEAAYQILTKERQTPEGAAKVDKEFAKDAELRELASQQDSRKPVDETQEEAVDELPKKVIKDGNRIEGAEKLSKELSATLTRMLGAIIHLVPNQTVVVLDTNQDVKNKWKEISNEEAAKTLKGFNDPKSQTIYISKEGALNDRRSDGLHIARHEMIHPIINALKSDPVFLDKLYKQAESMILNAKDNRVAQVVFAHARQYNGDKYKEELLVEFLNFFSDPAKLEAIIEAQPGMKNKVINFVNSILERLGISFRFSNESSNSDVLEILNQVKQGFSSGTPVSVGVATKNSKESLQAYKGITESKPKEISKNTVNEIVRLYEGGYPAFYGGNAAEDLDLSDVAGVGKGDADRTQSDLIGIKNLTDLLAVYPVVSIENYVKEYPSLQEILTQLGYKNIQSESGIVMAAPAFQDLNAEKSSLDLISESDFVDPAKETSSKLGVEGAANLNAVAKIIGAQVKFINNSDVNVASGYLKPNYTNNLSSPVIVVNLASSDSNSSIFGLAAFMVETLRKSSGRREANDATSYLFGLETEVRIASNKLESTPEQLTAREKNVILPILFTAESYLAQTSKESKKPYTGFAQAVDSKSSSAEVGNALVYALTSRISESISNTLDSAADAVRTGLIAEIETAFLSEINSNSDIQVETTEGMPFHKFLKLVFVDKALDKVKEPTSLVESARKAFIEILTYKKHTFRSSLSNLEELTKRVGLGVSVSKDRANASFGGYVFTKKEAEATKILIDIAVSRVENTQNRSSLKAAIPRDAEQQQQLEEEMKSKSSLFLEGHQAFIEFVTDYIALVPSSFKEMADKIKESVDNAEIIEQVDEKLAKKISDSASIGKMINAIKEAKKKGVDIDLVSFTKQARSKSVVIELPNAPKGYRYIIYNFTNNGAIGDVSDSSVEFGVRLTIHDVADAMRKDPRFSEDEIRQYRSDRAEEVKLSGGREIALGGYDNLPSKWKSGQAIAMPLMQFLQDNGLQTGVKSFEFIPAGTQIDNNWTVEELIRRGATEEYAKKYGYESNEATESNTGETRAILYNAWAARQMGVDVLVTKNQQDYLVPTASGNVYMIGRATGHDSILEKGQSRIVKKMYKGDSDNLSRIISLGFISENIIRESFNSSEDISLSEYMEEMAEEYGLKPLTDKQLIDIAKASNVAISPENIVSNKESFIDSYNQRNILSNGKRIANKIVVPSVMSYVSENTDGVLSLPPLTKVSESELQAYIESSQDDGMRIAAMEAQREANEKAILEATENKWWTWDKISKGWINRNQKLRESLEAGLGAYTRSILTRRAGAIRYGDTLFKKFEAKIFKGLSTADEKVLDDIIFLRRVIQIDKNRDFKKSAAQTDLARAEKELSNLKAKRKAAKPDSKKKDIDKDLKLQKKYINDIKKRLEDSERPKHPSHPLYGIEMNLEEAIKTLAAQENSLGKDKFTELNDRADKYFDSFSEILGMALDAGLINVDTYDRFKNDDYSPRVFLEHFFGDSHNSTFQGTNLSEEFIMSLKDGSNGVIFNDARMLLSTALRSVRAKGHQNLLMNAMHDEAVKRGFEGVEFMKELNKNKKDNVEPADKGFVNVFYRVDGELSGFQIKAELEPQLKGNVKDYVNIPQGLKKGLSWITGTTALKFFATGTSTAFAITAFVRFVPEVVFGRGVYDKKGKGFVPLMMGFAAMDSLIGLKDAVFNPKLVEEYMRNGGATTWMTAMGKPKKIVKRGTKGIIGNSLSKLGQSIINVASFAGEKSELAVRLAIYSRTKDNLRKEFPNMPEAELQSLAAEEALMLADFATSGTVSKNLDVISPYLNAGIQGFRGAGSYASKNKKMFSLKISQMYAGATVMYILAMMNVSDDEWENISEYKKQMNQLIPIGRDKEGNMQYLAIPRAHTFLPITAAAEVTARFIKDMIRGKEVKWDNEGRNAQYMENGKYILDAFIKSTPLPSIPPAVNAWIAYVHNYDMWSGQKIYKRGGDKEMENYIEGQYDPKVRDFYKVIALELYDKSDGKVDVSAKRMQAAVEKIITGDKNILVDKIYDFADAVLMGPSYTETAEKQGITLTEEQTYKKISDIETSLGMKGRIYVTPKKSYKVNERVKKVKKEANTELYKKRQTVKQLVKPFLGKTLIELPNRTKNTIKTLADGDAVLEKRLINYLFYIYRGNMVDDRVIDISFSDNKQEQVAKIEDIFEASIKDIKEHEIQQVLGDMAISGMTKTQIQALYLEIEKQQK